MRLVKLGSLYFLEFYGLCCAAPLFGKNISKRDESKEGRVRRARGKEGSEKEERNKPRKSEGFEGMAGLKKKNKGRA